ncbi:MAG TPA: glycosyltransferase family 4 protein [Candidatus Bathyarchaeia archaeon]|nr:glycosyltransferase family 4 protein [Candidatus Bathyarchaeia archaeon]
MKILLVHPRLSVKGGGERVAIHSIIAATKAGHEVHLLAEEFDETSFEDFYGYSGVFNDIKRLYYPAFRSVSGQRGLLYPRLIYNWFQIRRLSSIDSFDLVLSTQDIANVPSTPRPVAQYCYFTESFSHLAVNPSSPIWQLYYKPASEYYRKHVGRVGTLLSVSDYTKGFVKEKWGRDSTTLYPPCPIQDYSEYGGRRGRENLVVTVGRLVPEKGFDLFVDLARLLPETRFLAIASLPEKRSTYYEQLRQGAPDNVSFVLSPLRKVRDILGRAMAYVHCAKGEHFGITIVEAMAAGCVPVVHDSGGPREIVTADVGFRWRDLPTAVGQISALTNDDRLRQRLSTASSARAKRFRPEVFESEMIELFRRFPSRAS